MSGVEEESDLVLDSRLQTRFLENGVEHWQIVSDSRRRQRPVPVAHVWQRRCKLGSGTFGTVWLETCTSGPKAGQLRAVKEIAKAGDHVGPIDYTRELSAVAKFSHPRYTSCFVESEGWFESPTSIFITMEYLEFGDMHQYLAPPWPEPEAQLVASQLAQGISFMHRNKFAHRDLKPQNILVVERGPGWWVKISDFGISKRLEESTALRTSIGTRGYIAPELTDFRGFFSNEDASESYTLAIDIWALGQITFQMLTNRLAFSDAGIGNLFNYIVNNEAFPRTLLEQANASPACINFIESAMKAEPAARFTAEEALTYDWIATSAGPSMTEIGNQLHQTHINEPLNLGQSRTQASLPANAPTFQATAAWSTLTSHPVYKEWATQRATAAAAATSASAPPTAGGPGNPNLQPIVLAPGTQTTMASWDTLQGPPTQDPNLDIAVPQANFVQVKTQESTLGKPLYSASSSCVHTMVGHAGNVYTIAYSPDGRTMASGSTDKTIRIYDARSGAFIRSLTGHTGFVNGVSYSPDGKMLASSSRDKSIKFWDPETGVCVRTIRGFTRGYVYVVTFSPDGTVVASSARELTIRLWDVQTGTCVRTFEPHTALFGALVFAPDGKNLASGSPDALVKIWDTQTGTCIRTLEGHGSYIFSLKYSPDGRRIASSSDDKTLRIWDSQTGACLQRVVGRSSPMSSIAYSPDGGRILVGMTDGTIDILDSESCASLYSFKGHNIAIGSVAYAPDREQFASGSSDRTVKIWEIQRK